VQGRSDALVRFLIRRTLAAALVVFLVGSSTFLLSSAAQGDFFTVLFGFHASDDAAQHARKTMGLDRPVAALYADWLSHAARLDFGSSLMYQRPVGPLVAGRAANTTVLASSALALALLAGLPLGILTGSRSGAAAAVVRAVSGLCLSVPPLIAAILLVALAASTGIVPVGGMTSLASGPVGWTEWIRDVASHVPLPAVALALPFVAVFERVQSQALADALAQPSMTAVLARGLSNRQMLWRHAWRLSAKPVVAVAGPIAGTLLSGSFAVELVTSWPGLGRLTYDALTSRDIYLAAGCATAAAVFLAAGVFASDVLLAAVDPRVASPAPGAVDTVRS
jgi:peptide/nickel transport system permease protein